MQIVVVEDSIMYQNLIGSCLQAWGFSPIIVKDGSQAWEVLRDPTSPKLVLLDLVLPGLDGIEICRRIRQAGPECPYSYVIVLTSRDGKQDMLEALEAGADDYIAKPFDEMELKARLLAGKRILDLHDELVAARESMRHAATHDFLTGLANRGEVWNCLSHELDRSRREKKPVGIMIADIDHFKDVNDTLGHLFGDEALKEIARRLRSKLRAYDTVGRYGGEEFLLVLPGCNMATTLARADALRAAIADVPIVSFTQSRNITMSIGVTVADAPWNLDIEELLGEADRALYVAKQNGRNQVGQAEAAHGAHN